MKYLLLIFSLIFSLFFSLSCFAQSIKIGEIKSINSKIFIMRHALAPGYGDPVNFKIDDCKTQRNLNIDGVNQAKIVGDMLKKNGIVFSKIFSSFWCRCYKTLESMGFTIYNLHPGLNSFFQSHFDKKQTLNKLNHLIYNLPKDKGPYLFVTHYINILSLTGLTVDSGKIIVYDLKNKNSQELIFD